MDREQKNFKNRKRKKVCAFCADKIEHIDYKDAKKTNYQEKNNIYVKNKRRMSVSVGCKPYC